MSNYLAQLKAALAEQKISLLSPSKGSKGAFEPFEGEARECVSQLAPWERQASTHLRGAPSLPLADIFQPERPKSEQANRDRETRAAQLEIVDGLSRDAAETFAQLLCDGPPSNFEPAYWARVIGGAQTFADIWAGQAHRLGWSADDIFGLDGIAPGARHDHKGLAWLLTDGAVVKALDEDGADITTTSGTKQRFYRTPNKGKRGY